MLRLNTKICVVAGAARGIGRAVAEAFRTEGATVIITDKDELRGAATAVDLGCRFEQLDVGREAGWERLAATVPIVDVLVNNAGITGFEENAIPHDPENVTVDAWRAVHRVNLDNTFLGCRYAIRAMKERGSGSIINMSSRSGLVGIPAAAAYASSKAAVRNHTKSVALYCAQQGWRIRCNSIHPDAHVGTDARNRPRPGRANGGTCRRRAVEAVRYAQRGRGPSCHLASDDATYITGAELTIDGGLLAGSAASPQ